MAEDTGRQLHRRFATELSIRTRDLLSKEERTPAEDELMVHSAHASRYHWSHVGDARDFAMCDWQLSRVYAALDRPEPALWYAGLSLETSVESDLDPLHTAYAYEALARAFAISGEVKDAREALSAADALVPQIPDDDPRSALLDDLDDVRQLILLEDDEGAGA